MKSVILMTVIGLSAASGSCADRAPETGAKVDAATTKPAARSTEVVRNDIGKTRKQLSELIGSQKVFFDKASREEAAPKAIPVIKQMIGYFDELATIGDENDKQRAPMARQQFLEVLTVLGDSDAEAQLTKQAASPDKEVAMDAKTALLNAKWAVGSGDAAAQAKVLDGLEELAKTDPKSDAVAGVAMMAANVGATTPELKKRAESILIEKLTGEAATQAAEQMKIAAKMRGMEGKPLVLAAMGLDGQQFSTANLKGKVILVDFWATWCGPCRAELPRVKKIYADYHAKGLEVLGVSCDENVEALNKFLKANPDMPWPQLFDAAKPGWHPLATEYGVKGIPTMFLIDKKGVLRSVEAREDFEAQIPKLLAE